MSLGEFELISTYFLKASGDPDLIVGNGDDAAVIRTQGNLAVAVDTLVAGVHFPENADPALIARRALRVNLSDMAAMGARPRWFTLSLTLPQSDPVWLKQFSQGLFADAEHFQCQLIGGDTTKGPLSVSIQMLGEIATGTTSLTRAGALAGDLVVVTGTVGDAGAALEFSRLEQRRDTATEPDFLYERYWLPEPRVEFALRCQHLIRAALDISDGVVADIGHLCKQSAVDAQLQLEALPLSAPVRECWGADAGQRAIGAGDDYELCMAVSPQDIEEMQSIARSLAVPVSVIGEFCPRANSVPVVKVLDNQGHPVDIDSSGYRHFR